MPIVSIQEAAKLIGKSSQTLYRHVKNGKVSRTEDGFDTAELLRVYGALRTLQDTSIENDKQETSSNIDKDADKEVEYLKRENQLLREQLEKSQHMEGKLMQIIENRLPAPSSDDTLMGKIKHKFFD